MRMACTDALTYGSGPKGAAQGMDGQFLHTSSLVKVVLHSSRQKKFPLG